MDEKDLKNLIEKETEELHIPESLSPEAMEQKILEHNKKNKKNNYKITVAAAACCMLAIGVASGMKLLGITIDSSNDTVSMSAEEVSEEVVGTIASAKDYDQIYDIIKEQQDQMMNNQAKTYGAMEDIAVAETSTATADTGAAGYSDTNVREEGVGEADIIKTNGRQMFILNRDKIKIVSIESEEMEQLGTIQLESESYYAELYVNEDRVVAVYSQETYEEADANAKIAAEVFYRQSTVAEVFDISDPENPERIGKISQSGNYNTVRIVGDYVYLFSDFYADISHGRDGIAAYIPEVQGESIASTDILMPAIGEGQQYTVISSFSLKNPEEKIDKKAVFGADGMCYVSSESIYICDAQGNPKGSDVTQTCIRKLSYSDGKTTPVGQTKVDGTLRNSFSIDEYDGNLRMVTTVTPVYGDVMPLSGDTAVSSSEEAVSSNTLYILDENLEELSRIEELAPDEDVYSARFMGEIGYFVTYRQIDPLFSVDLSDPENPEILGELKIPGFSEYLHPYGEGQLLGIGMDVDETGTVTNGVKLSMFDTSDPTDVQEVEKYVIEDAYSTEVSYNYKAALVDADKNLIGFLAYCDGGAYYYVFSYGDDGFECQFEKDMLGYNNNIRGIYVGDMFYIVTGNTIESFTLDSFDKVDDIVL